MPQAIVEKSVNGKYPIGLRYTTPDLDAAESISAVICTITPGSGDPDLETSGSVDIDSGGKEFSWVVQKGVAGTEYTVQFKVTTDAGKIFEHPIRESILVKIVS